MYELKLLKQLTWNISVLYVEDDFEIAEAFKNYLYKLFKHVDFKQNGVEGLACFLEYHHDLVITDIQMPKMDGLKMSKEIKSLHPEQNILITSAHSDSERFMNSIEVGVDGYIIKPIDYNNLNMVLYKVAHKIKTFKEHALYEKNLEKLLKEKTDENLLLEHEKVENYERTLFALVDMIENRDTYTGKHSVRVATYSQLIAKELDFSQEECEEIYRAGILHDLGKIAIPDSLLLKPSSLNDNEYALIKEHVSIGFHMLKQIPMFEEVARIIHCHHERLDGTGYPNGLKGDEISIKSNIMAVSDAFDAMTTNRIYKGRKTIEMALDELKKLSGTHFRQEIVDAAVKVLKYIDIDSTINQLPKTQLEEERFSYFYKDSVTTLYNELYLEFILSKNKFEHNFRQINIVFLNNFGNYNQHYGWRKGNSYLASIAKQIVSIYPNHLIFRMHGDDFVILTKIDESFDSQLVKSLEMFLHEADCGIELVVKGYDLIEEEIFSLEKLESFI